MLNLFQHLSMRPLPLRGTAARRLAKNSPLDCFYPALQGRSLGSAIASFWGWHPRTLRAPTIPNVIGSQAGLLRS